jgi:uncharacterized BrkB/YihY/UPF0761 family membrane protein
MAAEGEVCLSESDVEKLLVASCVVLIGGCVLFSCFFGIRPRTRREWQYVTATLAFILWLLAGFAFLRST